MSRKAGNGTGNSGSGRREGSRQSLGHGPNRGRVRNRGELRKAEEEPWRFTESGLPQFVPGVLDPAAILTSVSEALLPVVEKELSAATERLGAVLADQGSEADLLPVFRAELMRRVLPQFTEAVRKGVLESIGTRRMHLSQLAVLHRQALNAKTLKSVLARLDDEAAKAGLQIVGDTGDRSLFNVVEEQPGVLKTDHVTFELVAPAYVDKESGKVIERGWLQAVAETARVDMTRQQRRRATHAKDEKKQSVKEAPVQHEKKKSHRGQDPTKTQSKGNGRRSGGLGSGAGGNRDRRGKGKGKR